MDINDVGIQPGSGSGFTGGYPTDGFPSYNSPHDSMTAVGGWHGTGGGGSALGGGDASFKGHIDDGVSTASGYGGAHMSSHASSSNPAVQIDPDNPPNPGSRLHGNGCKPCNKYSPARPNDSCKHVLDCEFCHARDHVRPKHRGQRGRHALQRKQYLDMREKLPEELRVSVDNIYKVPPEVMDELKKMLANLDDDQKSSQVKAIMHSVLNIGDAAQDKRPDSVRVRGTAGGNTRADTESATAQDLDSRFKWLTGTLHLMVRKIWDSTDGEQEQVSQLTPDMTRRLKEVTENVDEILGALRRLPSELENRLKNEPCAVGSADSDSQLQKDLLEAVRKVIPGQPREWIRRKVLELAQGNLDEGISWEEKVKPMIENLKECFDFLPSTADTSSDAHAVIQGCTDLKDLPEIIEDLTESIKDKLLNADSWEALERLQLEGGIRGQGDSCNQDDETMIYQ
eukprot:TRINITY_DN55624_c0_g1_i1.p1 TRINITY_DN55624_c0_g1~~TRINITY_DN55624_c0_g1_i1.p1  ORF type:complete len:455 (+),score=87.67 TRINITY_DN55624_c0_g1_i1:105-1469(+)